MKNQNDLIALIVSVVLGLAGVLTFMFTAPKPTAPTPPTPVVTAPAQLQPAAVVFADTLPGGGNAGGGGGAPSGRGLPGPGGVGGPGGPTAR